MRSRDGGEFQGGGDATTNPMRPDYDNLYAMRDVDWDDPTVAQIARTRGTGPVETMIDLMLENEDQLFVQPIVNVEKDDVLGMLKQALGTQNLPPGQVIIALSMFMTFMVMSPTLERINEEAIVPYRNGEIVNQIDMWNQAKEPIRDFMFAQIDAAQNWSSVYTILNYRGVDTSEPEMLKRGDVDMLTLVPAYMLSELKVAFLMGFRVYLPFLIIDMVVASLLISMSMMMLPPVLISLPFKVLLFVLVDGWNLVVGSLMVSFVQPNAVALAPAIGQIVGVS